MSDKLLRGTVLRVLSDGSTDGTTRLLTTATIDNERGLPLDDCLVMVSIQGRHEALLGDSFVIRTEGVFFHPANTAYGYAEAVPEPSLEGRLARIASARMLSVSVSRTSSVPGASINLGGKIIRRHGTLQDPILQRAYALISHRSMGGTGSNVLLLQPSSLPAPLSRWEALRGSVAMVARHVSRGKLIFFPYGITETSAMEALGRVWHEAPPSLRHKIMVMPADMIKSARLSPSVIINKFDMLGGSLSVVVPYDPVTPPHVFWHAISMMPQVYSPKIQMESAALDEITAFHEISHTVQDKFVPLAPRETLRHRRECFADAISLLAWLQGGGDPLQARLWADARHLSLFGGASDYLTGLSCDAAIVEGLALRAAIVQGEPQLPAASLFALAASIPSLAHPAEVRLAVDAAMAAAGGRATALLTPLALAEGCVDLDTNKCITRSARALDTVWAVRNIIGGEAGEFAKTEDVSLRRHIAQLYARGMGHLASRSIEVSRAHASDALGSVLNAKSLALPMLATWVGILPGMDRLLNFPHRADGMEALAAKKIFSARSALSPPHLPRATAPASPIQPYVMLRQSERSVTRGMLDDVQPLYTVHPEKRLNKLRLATEVMQQALVAGDRNGFTIGIKTAITAGVSLVSDWAALRASYHYMPSTQRKSGTAMLVQLVEDMQREPSTLVDVENSWEEWCYWAKNGPLNGTHMALSSVLLDSVMCKVARHGMWTDGIVGGERLDAQDIVFTNRDLSGRNLDSCRLVRPDFTGCTLENVSFHGASITSPCFKDAKCTGMNIEDSGLRNEDFKHAVSMPNRSDEDKSLKSPLYISSSHMKSYLGM